AVFVSTIAPPPFPTSWFFLAAGAFHHPQKKFFSAVTVGRTLRYLLVTLLAAHYGRKFLRVARHPENYLIASLVITAVLVLITVLLLYFRRRPELEPRTEP